MSVKKWKFRSGKISWCYVFDAPGSTKEKRKQIRVTGFTSKGEAQAAEASRRIEEQKKYELAQTQPVRETLPTTLAMLLEQFLKEHAAKKLAPKTSERYWQQLPYISPGLMNTPLEQIKPLHLSEEWARLLESGGHSRKTKEPRPLSAKTVRNIAGMVSSAFARGIKWGLVELNPVTNSEPPKGHKHMAIALTPAQQELVIEAASGPWCMRAYLEIAAATGCRRGELLALRWSDIQDGRLMIERSLSQTKGRLEFKTTKTGKPRPVALPESARAALQAHRAQQDALRHQFGTDYRKDLDLVFAEPNGEPLKPDSISGTVSALFKRLKIDKPKGAALHLLRHTHTSVLLASGVPLPAVSARLGHGSVRTTQEIYAHMITGQDEEAAKAWQEFQRKAAESQPKPGSRKV
jgi:integrase